MRHGPWRSGGSISSPSSTIPITSTRSTRTAPSRARARNARTLLVCALAWQHAGAEEEARGLETKADELGMEGYEYSQQPPRLRLALARRERPDAGPPIGSSGGHVLTFGLSHLSARLDAVEALTNELLEPTTYLEPFALRALGIVREDQELVAQALARFEAMRIDWHAAETRRLILQV